MVDKIQRLIFILLAILLSFNAKLNASLIISEIMPNPELGGEWIEIYNNSINEISIESWMLVDLAGNAGMLPENSRNIPPMSFAILAQNNAAILELKLAPGTIGIVLQSWAGLNNEGDELALTNQSGDLIDQIIYGSDATKVKGRSWERIKLDSSGKDRANWGECASIVGHTAGKANSLYVTDRSNNISIIVDPNPFSPDGDGIEDVATISFQLPTVTSRVSAYVYDLEANLVCQLASDLPAGPSLPTLQWAGKSNSGDSLPIGRYIIYLESLDYQSGEVLSGKKVIILARNR